MLKGTATIELTDVKTGKKEVVEHDNLVTNAINDLLTLNPLGMRFRSYSNIYDNTSNTAATNQYSELGASFEAGLLPICPKAIGGVLLYENALEENPDKYYAPMDNLLVGYSSNDVNGTDDIRRGSMNLNESGPLEDGKGYRFVFDFTTAQANGTIAALGLTSARGGKAGYGAAQDKVGYPMLAVDGGYSTTLRGTSASAVIDDDFYTKYSFVSADFIQDLFYYARVLSPNTIEVGKVRANLATLNLTENTKWLEVVESKIITTNSFASSTSRTDTSFANNALYTFAGTFIDGDDGCIWGFQHSNNIFGNSSGVATVLWIKISMEDFSFEEGEWNLDAQLYPFGFSKYNDVGNANTSYKGYTNLAIIKNGKLYALKYDKYGVYVINLSNPADMKLLECNFKIDVRIWDTYGGAPRHTEVIDLGGVISYRNAYINNDEIYQVGYGTALAAGPYEGSTANDLSKNKGLVANSMTRPHFGPFFCTFMVHYSNPSSSAHYRRHSIIIYLMTPYLATINNLDTPVEKTADKTMKITYILREE